MTHERLDLSIVIPVFNEEGNVRPLYDALDSTLRGISRSYEIIFVDDGSRDETFQKLRTLRDEDPKIRILRFKRNFGQTPATRVGIRAALGDVIVTLDGDLQNDPADIPKLLDRIDDGDDLVVGWRRERKDSTLFRTLPSRAANWLISRMTGARVHDSGCSLRAYRREMIQRVPLYSEMHRFIPAMSKLQDARISEVVVRHHPRERGQSKYGLSRIGSVLLDVVAIKMLISFGRRPMYGFFLLSVPFLFVGCASATAHVLWRLGGGDPDLLISPTLFLLCAYTGVHFLLIGLLAELVIRSGGRTRTPRQRIRIDRVEPAA